MMKAVALLDLTKLLRFQPSTLMTAYTAWLVRSFVLDVALAMSGSEADVKSY